MTISHVGRPEVSEIQWWQIRPRTKVGPFVNHVSGIAFGGTVNQECHDALELLYILACKLRKAQSNSYDPALFLHQHLDLCHCGIVLFVIISTIELHSYQG